MFLTEIKLRYPGVPHEDLVSASVGAINKLSTITAEIVRTVITTQERILELADTTPLEPTPVEPVQTFLTLLSARRGAYTWEPGPSKTFTKWVNGPLPLERPLPITARINCWEAVLVSAVEAGLVSIGVLRGSYLNTDGVFRHRPSDRVFDVFIREGTKEVNHPAPGANDIEAGNVIMIQGSSGRLHHVLE